MIKHIISLDSMKFQEKPSKTTVGVIINNLVKQENNKKVDIKELLDCLIIPNGQSWSPAVFKNNSKEAENWVSQGYFALDIDSEDLNEPDPEELKKNENAVKVKKGIFGEEYNAHNLTYKDLLTRCEKYGVLPCAIHTSFSANDNNNKYRVIFQLTETIINPKISKLIQYLLFMMFPESDTKCATDISRFFFGGKKVIYENFDNYFNPDKLFKGFKVHLEENYSKNMEYIRKKINFNTRIKQIINIDMIEYLELTDKDIESVIEHHHKNNKSTMIKLDFGDLIKDPGTTEKLKRTPPTIFIDDYDKKWLGEALTFISAEPFEHWRNVGMALKQSYGETAKHIWIDWSMTVENHDELDELDKKWEGFKPNGELTVASIRYMAQKNGWDSTPETIKKFNKDHFQSIDSKGNEVIYKINKETEKNSFGKNITITNLSLMKRQPFINLWDGIGTLKYKKMKNGMEVDVFENQVKFLLRHDSRRIVDKIVFKPDLKYIKDNEYNLWDGFAINPVEIKDVKTAKFDLYYKHLFEIMANGDKKIAKYILGWMAFAVQHPSKVAEVAIVFIGQQGSGKSLFVELFGQIFGSHYICLQSQDALTGKFNSHLAHKVLVFADEAIWKGDIKALQKLKNNVTNPKLNSEGKNKDMIIDKNFMHIMMASNDRTVLKLDNDDRRFCILELNNKWASINNRSPEKKIKLKKYFDNMVEQFNKNGGVEHFFTYLKELDIDKFNIKDYPETSIKNEHIIEGFKGKLEGFIHELLDDGKLYDYQSKWKHVGKKDLFNKYIEYVKLHNPGRAYPLGNIMFGKEINKIFGNHIKTSRGSINYIDYQGNKIVKTQNTYMFAPLKSCRIKFENYFKIKIEWDDIKETETIQILDFGEENSI